MSVYIKALLKCDVRGCTWAAEVLLQAGDLGHVERCEALPLGWTSCCGEHLCPTHSVGGEDEEK